MRKTLDGLFICSRPDTLSVSLYWHVNLQMRVRREKSGILAQGTTIFARRVAPLRTFWDLFGNQQTTLRRARRFGRNGAAAGNKR